MLFFSSRRRHTRYWRDWSSDVCSSDLSYLELAEHYGITILPARPGKPRDKAKVEQSVLLAERWILARLRNARFFSLAELDGAITTLTADLNARIMRGFGASRAELFAALRSEEHTSELQSRQY